LTGNVFHAMGPAMATELSPNSERVRVTLQCV